MEANDDAGHINEGRSVAVWFLRKETGTSQWDQITKPFGRKNGFSLALAKKTVMIIALTDDIIIIIIIYEHRS